MSEPEEGEIDLRARGPDGVPVDPIGTPALSDNGRTVTPTVSVGVATLSCVDNHERLQKRKRNDDHAADDDDDEQTGQKLTSKQRKSLKRAHDYARTKAGETIVKVHSPGTIIARRLVAFIGQQRQAGRLFDCAPSLIQAWFESKVPELLIDEIPAQLVDEMVSERATTTHSQMLLQTDLLSGEGRVDHLTTLILDLPQRLTGKQLGIIEPHLKHYVIKLVQKFATVHSSVLAATAELLRSAKLSNTRLNWAIR